MACFQSFLTSRPRIKEIAYSYRPQLSASFLAKYAPGLQASPITEATYATARWQPEQFFVRSFNPANPTAEVIIGYNRGTFWQISGGVVTVCIDDSTYAPTLSATLAPFFDVLSLGIASLKDGSLRWDGLGFQGLTRDERTIHGRLSVADGKPSYLDFTIESSACDYRVEYEYASDSLVLGIPSRFHVGVRPSAETGFTRVTSVEISNLQFASADLEQDVVAPYLSAAYTNRSWVVISNGVSFVRTPAGVLVQSSRIPRYRQSRVVWVRVTFALIAIGFLGGLFLAGRRRKSQRNK